MKITALIWIILHCCLLPQTPLRSAYARMMKIYRVCLIRQFCL